ncbi:uncharacterized protein LOC123219598 [Mangifera indica]|uniref:uncharacterized protein LOC123219598 n=1 Tax=Mangifera indica TaxID=29780 RepID=UPI001CFA62A6|nr:uncharacterized protein LOC123219598 [Mangifera indica]
MGSSGTKSSKRWVLFRGLIKKESLTWKFLGKWKRLNLQLSFIDDICFKFLSVFEAVVLVSTLCFFFLCCGCHF